MSREQAKLVPVTDVSKALAAHGRVPRILVEIPCVGGHQTLVLSTRIFAEGYALSRGMTGVYIGPREEHQGQPEGKTGGQEKGQDPLDGPH